MSKITPKELVAFKQYLNKNGLTIAVARDNTDNLGNYSSCIVRPDSPEQVVKTYGGVSDGHDTTRLGYLKKPTMPEVYKSYAEWLKADVAGLKIGGKQFPLPFGVKKTVAVVDR